MTPDLTKVYLAACRANAAYEMDPAKSQAGFLALQQNLVWLGIYQDDSHQAVACIGDNGEGYLSISGTRFSDGMLGDLATDAWILPKSLGNGVLVTKGAFDGLDAMWDWANKLVDASTIWHVCGHSLGAWRTRYTPVFIGADRIASLYSFESPKGANTAYWAKYKNVFDSKLVNVINGRDLFVSWPFVSFDWCHPQMENIWLQDVGYRMVDIRQWTGGNNIADHSMQLVEDRLKVIANV